MNERTLETLCRDIRLAEPATEQVLKLEQTLDFEALSSWMAMMSTKGRWEEGLSTLRTLLAPDELGLKMLTCCLKQALATWETYKDLGISDEIYMETMACFSRFVGEHVVSFGTVGFDRAFWTVRQLSALLFRVGQLEYELVTDNGVRQVHLHIPSGSDMRDELLDASLEEARAFLSCFFPEYADAPMLCDSWMLSPTLLPLLPADSRIIRFQKRFRSTPVGTGNNYMEWVYKRTDLAVEDFPEDTGLQRRLKAYLLNGGQWTEVVGVLK